MKPKKRKPTNGKPEAEGTVEAALARVEAELAKTRADLSRVKNQLRKGRPKRPATYKKSPFQRNPNEPDPGDFHISEILPLDELKTSYIEWAIRKLKGNKPAAAEKLDMSLRTIYNLFPGEK